MFTNHVLRVIKHRPALWWSRRDRIFHLLSRGFLTLKLHWFQLHLNFHKHAMFITSITKLSSCSYDEASYPAPIPEENHLSSSVLQYLLLGGMDDTKNQQTPQDLARKWVCALRLILMWRLLEMRHSIKTHLHSEGLIAHPQRKLTAVTLKP